MPWTVADVDRHKKGLSARKKRQWAYIANSILKRTGDEGQAIRKANSAVNRTKAYQPNVGGGVDRAELRDSDFVLADERKFPVVIPKDVRDAVSSWGRYRGGVSFETFKKNLIALAKRKGSEFEAALPKEWTEKAQQDAPLYGPAPNTEQCWNCAYFRQRDNYCELYDFTAKREYWCAGWEGAPIQLLEANTDKAARYSHIDFRPPQGVKNAAKRGLELRRQFERGGTAVGVARARDLSNGTSVSPDTIKRMRSYFARHAVDKKGKDWGNAGNPSAGYIAWLLWGGDAGRAWAGKVYRQVLAADKKATVKGIENHATDHAMLAFYLPPENAERVALDSFAVPFKSDVLASQELHITLVYLGEIGNIAPYKNQIAKTAAEFAGIAPALMARTGGLIRFAKDNDGLNAICAQVDSLGIQEWRMALVELLRRNGVPIEDRYGYTPHITLAYIPKDVPTPPIAPDTGEMILDRLVLAWGDELTAFPLVRGAMKAAVSDGGGGKGYGARKGEVIRGNLARGEGGKFVAAGKKPATSEKPEAESKPERRTPAPRRQPGKPAPKKAAPKKGGATAADRAKREAERQAKRAQLERERQEMRAKREQERQADRAKRAAEREEDRQKKAAAQAAKPGKAPKAGGGEKKPAAEQRQQRIAENRSRTIAAMADKGGLDKRAAETILDLADGGSPDEKALESLLETGLIRKTDAGAYVLSPTGVTYTRALNSGNVEVATRALERARKRKKEFQGFQVFKDANGQYRWVIFSSNAYLDRDNEIVSEAALTADVERSDKDGLYGPLRWWHVGTPNPLNREAPWGEGLDLGMCDFRAMHGRVLVESGTFKTERIGEAASQCQTELRASIGMLHPYTEPSLEDGIGVYKNVFIFERSLLPVGTESNPFTRVYVHNGRKADMNAKKLEKFRQILPGAVDDVLGGAESAQKEADGAKVLFKEQRAQELDAILAGFGQSLKGFLGLAEATPETEEEPETTEKQAPESDYQEEEKQEDGEEAMEDEEMEDDGAVYLTELTADEFAQMLTDALAQSIGPVLQALDIDTKMGGMMGAMNELKAAMGGMVKKKEAEEAAIANQASEIETLKAEREKLAAQLAELDTKVKELAGEVPPAFNAGFFGFRASDDPSTVVKEQAQEVSQYPTPAGAVDNLLKNIGSVFQNGTTQ